MQEQQGLAARRAALDLASAALLRRGGLEEALARAPYANLEGRERVFARALAMTVLRRLGQIDQLLGPRLRTPPPNRVRDILRAGVAQIRWMEVADHAAVSTCVELAQEDPATRPFKGLVNAVLRGVGREAAAEPDPQALVPAWLYARWSAAFGHEAALSMAALVAEEPATDLTPRAEDTAVQIAGMLEGEVLPGPTVRTFRRGDLTGWPGFEDGAWWVQDASSATPARLLAVRPGESAVDLCAAPGGKTLQLAAAGARVTSLDRSALRLQRLQANLARTRLEAETIVVEASAWQDPRQFDAVLLDAPCTSTGAYRRHPDALWTTRPSDIAGLGRAQARLLASAADRVAPGGRLLYCVCSLEPEEGEGQVEEFLRGRADFRLDPLAAGEGGSPPQSLQPQGWLRVLPHHRPGGTDGFFAARMVRLPL